MANALAYAPPKAMEKKTYGLATIQVGNEGKKARVVFVDSQDQYDFGMDALPRSPKLERGSKDTYMVVLSSDKTEVEKIGPADGSYHAKVVEISRPEEGADPAPYLVEKTVRTGDKAGQKYSYMEFKLFFEVQRGRFKGVQIPCWLHYLWEQDPDDPENTRWRGDPSNPNAKHLPRLVDVSEQVGAVSSPIEWPEDGNILPVYFDRILKADKMVILVIKKGYIDTVSHSEYEDEAPVAQAPADDFESESEDEFDEPKLVKKPVKKNGNGKKDTKSDL